MYSNYQNNNNWIGAIASIMGVFLVGMFMATLTRTFTRAALGKSERLPQTQSNWLEPFYFRGLKFREHSSGIGLQVYNPGDFVTPLGVVKKGWYSIEGLNWKTSKDYYSYQYEVGLWKDRRHYGSLKFPEPPRSEKRSPQLSPQVLIKDYPELYLSPAQRTEFTTKDSGEAIKRLTEHELVNCLVMGYFHEPGGLTPERLLELLGDYPRTRSIIATYEEWKRGYENPDLYWGERINRLKEHLRELEEKKARKEKPPCPYRF